MLGSLSQEGWRQREEVTVVEELEVSWENCDEPTGRNVEIQSLHFYDINIKLGSKIMHTKGGYQKRSSYNLKKNVSGGWQGYIRHDYY